MTPVIGVGNGSISPDTPQTVDQGWTTDFLITPDSGWVIDSITTDSCDGSLNGNTYTTAPVNTIGADASIEDLATQMISNRSNPLPVVDASGRMIGIVSRTDVLAVFEDIDVQLEEEMEEGDAERKAASHAG